MTTLMFFNSLLHIAVEIDGHLNRLNTETILFGNLLVGKQLEIHGRQRINRVVQEQYDGV